MPSIHTGDDVTFEVTLTQNNEVFQIDSGATVEASLIHDYTATAVGPVVCDSGAVGASWSAGVVVVVFPAATSATFPHGRSTLEIQVDDPAGSGITTWKIPDIVVLRDFVE